MDAYLQPLVSSRLYMTIIRQITVVIYIYIYICIHTHIYYNPMLTSSSTK